MFAFSEADMELGSSLSDLASIRVVVVPVGQISESRFEELATMVTSISEVPLKALPRRLIEDKEISAKSGIRISPSPMIAAGANKIRRSFGGDSFSNLKNSGNSDSASGDGDDMEEIVRIRYELLRPDANNNLVVPQASEWEGFRASRRVWGVVGIFDMDEGEALDTEEDAMKLFEMARGQFSSTLVQYRSSSVSRCLAFATVDAVDKPGMKVFLSSIEDMQMQSSIDGHAPVSFGVVPYSAQSSMDEVRLEIRAQVIHIIGMILTALENCLRVQMKTTGPILSPMDMKHTVENQSKLKYRRQGRLDKCAGDLYLLMACPSLAQANYKQAIEQARNHNDGLWLASSLEGLSAAMIATTNGPENVDMIIAQSADTFKLYRKRRLIELEVAAAMKIATFLAEIPERRREALETAQHAAQAGEALRPAKKRAALLTQLVRLTCGMNAVRKGALYLYQLGTLYQSSRKWKESYDISLEVTKLLAKDYGRGRASTGITTGWGTLRRTILLEAASAAAQMSDDRRKSRCLASALSLSQYLLSEPIESDDELMAMLRNLTELMPEIDSSNIRLISLANVDTMKASAIVRDRSETVATKTGPFIFSALRDDKEKEVETATWIKGEPTTVEITFESFIRACIDVKIIALLVRSVSNEEQAKGISKAAASTHSESLEEEIQRSRELVRTCVQIVRIPPMTKTETSSKLTTGLECEALKEGTLEVMGAVVQVFGESLMRLDLQSRTTSPLVKVFPPLSVLEVTFFLVKGDTSIAAPADGAAFHLYNGEAESLRVQIRNIGTEDIHRATVEIVASDEAKELLCIENQEMTSKFETLCVMEERSFDIVFGTTSRGDGLARLECITEHSSIPCKKIYRETRSTVTIRTKSVVNLDSVEIIRLSDGRIAAALEFYNALTTLLNLRAESVAGSTDEARVGNTRDLSETMVDPNHRAVLIVPVRASEVSMPLSLHPTKLRFDVHWNAIAAGNRGVVTFCVAPTGTLSVLSRPEIDLMLCIDGHKTSSSDNPLAIGTFHKLRIVVIRGNKDSRDDEDDGLLDVRICQENGRGGREPITEEAKVSIVGVSNEVRCSLKANYEHVFKVRFDSAGYFGLEASLQSQFWQFTRFWRLQVAVTRE